MFGLRGFATGSAAVSARSTIKPLTSRKTYLVDLYAHLLRSNAVVLALHNSTLLLNEDRQFRADLSKIGAQLTVVRSSLMKVALRGLHGDPACIPKKETKQHPMALMFSGPSAIITLRDLDPVKVDQCVTMIDKSASKLVLLGGLVHGTESPVFRDDLDILRRLPSLPELQAQLVGVLTVLGGAGLTQTLEATQQSLTLSLANRPEN